MEQREPSCTVGGNRNGYNLSGKQYAVCLLGIYPEKNMGQKDTCIPVFIAAQFTIAKNMEET